MTDYFTNLMRGWLENEEWIAQLTPHEPVVYIAAGIFGIFLFIGFIVSIVAICLALRFQADASAKRRSQLYSDEQKEAAKIVVSALRSSGMQEYEIREMLMKQYHFDELTADALLSGHR